MLEAALAQVLREEIQLTVAGRTDTGVHALGQVASFDTEAPLPPDLARNLNGVTPRRRRRAPRRGRSPTASTPASTPARAPTSTAWRPRRPASPFERGRALCWPHEVDREALDACAAALLGTHDFTAFTPTQTDHVRFERDVFAARWSDEPSPWGGDAILAFRITADAFMRNMVRALVGTMLEVASGRRTVENFTALLEEPPRTEGGDTAPPHASSYLRRQVA